MQVLMLSQLSNTRDSREAASHLHSERETLLLPTQHQGAVPL